MDFGFLVLDSGFLVLDSGFLALDFGSLAVDFRFVALDSGFQDAIFYQNPDSLTKEIAMLKNKSKCIN